jgi:predicted N-acetyltransferase YhbS
MITDFRQASIDAVCEIHNATFPARYAIDPLLLKQHTVDSPLFDWGASLIEPGKAFVVVKRSADRLYKGPSSDLAHICTFGFNDPTVLLDLLKESKRCLINRGVLKLQFGTDSGHFFPGCPIDCPAVRDFLLIAGFQEGGLAHDLERDLADYVMPKPPPEGFEFRAVQSEDLPELAQFFREQFPGRWQYDTFHQIDEEDNPSIVFGLFQGKTCHGFALTQLDGCKTQIGGAVWKKDLGDHWCSLGPIGVSKEVRGKGCGGALLGMALKSLKEQGGRRCIIDWTTLVDFYGLHGFEVTRSYHYCALDLERP